MIPLARHVFDVLMPPICSVCGDRVRQRDEAICDPCRAGFQAVGTLVCAHCGAPVLRKQERRCRRCPKETLHFRSARSVFLYRTALRDAIHAFKYYHRFELGRPLARAMFMGLPDFSQPQPRPENRPPLPPSGDPGDPGAPAPLPEVLIPVPMHFLRRLRRGYNHAEELAVELSRLAAIPVQPRWLIRSRYTPRQSLLPPERRRENIFGAFTAPAPEALRGCRLALVDDVLTSGHTVNECARVLLEAGAAAVQVLTLARA